MTTPETQYMTYIKDLIHTADAQIAEASRSVGIAIARRETLQDLKRRYEDLYFNGQAQ